MLYITIRTTNMHGNTLTIVLALRDAPIVSKVRMTVKLQVTGAIRTIGYPWLYRQGG